jgi:gluconokinase
MVLDAGLRVTSSVRHPTTLWQDPSGAATLDPDGYVEATVACLDELHKAGALAGVTAAAASCQWHSLIPLDAAHRPIGPGLSWMDTRPTPPPDRAPVDPEAFRQRTGAWWHGLYWPARIAWMRGQGVHARRWAGLAEYVTFRLLDEACGSLSAVSGTGAVDTTACRWDPEALDLAGVDERQVPVIAPDEFRGRLRAGYARRWPELSQAAWSLPIGDGAASTLGSGCGVGGLSVTVGTSAAVRLICAGAPRVPERVWRYRVDHSRSVLGVAQSGGGVLYEWATRLVAKEPSKTELDALAPGQHGLVVLPFLAGHRPPLPAGSAGTIHGLRLSTTAVDIVAAMLEAVCHELADAAHTLTPAGIPQTVPSGGAVVLNGGAVAGSSWFAHRLTAAFGGSALVNRQPEVGALGAARLATGLPPGPTPEPIEADPEHVAAMEAARERHHALRDLLASASDASRRGDT